MNENVLEMTYSLSAVVPQGGAHSQTRGSWSGLLYAAPLINDSSKAVGRSEKTGGGESIKSFFFKEAS